MRLVVRIMSHGSRTPHAMEMKAKLLAQQADLDVEVITDHHNNGPWITSKRCWESGLHQHGDWVLVLQDDISFCSDFVAAAKHIAMLHPLGDPISFFLPREVIDRAVQENVHYASTTRYLWAQATMLDSSAIRLMLQWTERNEARFGDSKNDDARLREFFRERLKRPVLVTVPNLVEHLDMPSVMKHNFKYEGRRSRAYIGDDGIAMNIDWSNKVVCRE